MKNKYIHKHNLFLLVLVWVCLFFMFSPRVFAATEVVDDIMSDTVWTLAESPYVVRDTIILDPDVTLTIQPGVIVKFDYAAGIHMYGKLIAEGTQTNKIHFTSLSDDSLGGDTNADADSTLPLWADWQGLSFSMSTGSVLSHVSFSYPIVALDIDDASSVDVSNVSGVQVSNFAIASNGSHINLTHGKFSEIYMVVSVEDDATANIKDIFVDTAYNSAIQTVYSGAVRISDFSFYNMSNTGFTLVGDSDTRIEIDNGVIHNSSVAIECHGNFGSVAVVNISRVNVRDNYHGIANYLCEMPVTGSSFADSIYYGYYNPYVFPMIAENNYWGDSSGPAHPTNPEGMGTKIGHNVSYRPFLTEEPSIEYQWEEPEEPEEPTRDPVIIIPGITGSYLNKNYGDNGEIWPNANTLVTSLTDNFLDDLALNPDGTEKPEFPMTVGDIIRRVEVEILGQDLSTSHVFDNMIADLESAGYVEGVDLFVFPYDWRYSTAVSAGQLTERIDEILDISGAEQVDIISHSMGGIVAKKYIADHGRDKIDQLVFLGTPHLGSPLAFKTLTWGDNLGYKWHNIPLLSINEVKFISQNFPSMFELLPSREYVDDKWSRYVTDATGKYIGLDLDYTKTKDLMVEEGRNDAFFAGAEGMHSDTDNMNLSDIQVYNFTGCSIATPGRFIITRHSPKKVLGINIDKGYDITYVDGDQTVPTLSSRDELGGEQYFVRGTSHGSLPNDESVRAMVMALLGGSAVAEYGNIVSQDQCGITGTKIGVHSPVALHVADSGGNHTGPTGTGDIEYNIADAQYDTIEDEKFAFLPAGSNYTVSLNPEALGVYDFYIENIVNGITTSTRYWNEMPIDSLTMRSRVEINGGDVVIKVDEDGDGVFERSVSPSSVLDQSQSVDRTAPETTASVAESSVVLGATDDNTGVLKTEYSLDGETWVSYFSAIDQPGKTIKYYSTDKAGNVEATKEITLPERAVFVNNQPPSTGGGLAVVWNNTPNMDTENKDIQNIQVVPAQGPLSKEGQLLDVEKILPRLTQLDISLLPERVVVKESENPELFGETDQTDSLFTASAANATRKTPSAGLLVGVFAGVIALGYVAKRFIKL